MSKNYSIYKSIRTLHVVFVVITILIAFSCIGSASAKLLDYSNLNLPLAPPSKNGLDGDSNSLRKSFKKPTNNNNCSRFHQISQIDQPGLFSVKVTTFLDQPMLAGFSIDNHLKKTSVVWYTFNVTSDTYEINLIAPCSVQNGIVRGFEKIERKNKYFGIGSISNLNTFPVIGDTPVRPSKDDFFLRSPGPDKNSTGVVLILDNTNSSKPQFFIYQAVFGNDLGPVLTFKLATLSNSTRDCAIFTVWDKNDLEAIIFCFHPLDIEQYDDEALHFFQQIPLKLSPVPASAPLLATVQIGNKTLVMITDTEIDSSTVTGTETRTGTGTGRHLKCQGKRQMSNNGHRSYNNGANTTSTQIHGNVVNIWAHEPTISYAGLAHVDTIRIPNIVALDSVLAGSGISFLAIGSRSLDASHEREVPSGVVTIFKYEGGGVQKYVKNEVFYVVNITQLRFQVLTDTNEVFLFALSANKVDNISIYKYSIQEATTDGNGWVHLCSITVPNATFLDTSSFVYQGKFKSHLIAVTPSGATVVET